MLVQNQVEKDAFERSSSARRSFDMVEGKDSEALPGVASRNEDYKEEVLGHRWLLLRHGQTNFNADGRVQGSSDTSRLSDEGRRQARAVGAFLKTLHIDKVYVSPLARAQETLQHAEEVAGTKFASSKVVVNDLREVDLHEWEGLYKHKIRQQWPEIYRQWRGDKPLEFRLESGAYPIKELWERASGVWQQILDEAAAEEGSDGPLLGTKTSLMTGHNGINQALLAVALGLGCDYFRKFEFPNCGVVELVWEPGEEKARMWRWLYPEQTAWKTVADTVRDVSYVSDSDSGEEAFPSPCTD